MSGWLWWQNFTTAVVQRKKKNTHTELTFLQKSREHCKRALVNLSIENRKERQFLALWRLSKRELIRWALFKLHCESHNGLFATKRKTKKETEHVSDAIVAIAMQSHAALSRLKSLMHLKVTRSRATLGETGLRGTFIARHCAKKEETRRRRVIANIWRKGGLHATAVHVSHAFFCRIN